MSKVATSPLDRYWYEIRGKTAEHATTKNIWDAVKADAARDGVTLEAGSWQRMNQLRGLASSQQYGIEQLRDLTYNDAIPSSVIKQDIDSGPIDFQGKFPEYRVQYQHIIEKDGAISAEWRADYIFGELPETKGDLMEELTQSGEALCEQDGTDQGANHVGIGDVLITQV